MSNATRNKSEMAYCYDATENLWKVYWVDGGARVTYYATEAEAKARVENPRPGRKAVRAAPTSGRCRDCGSWGPRAGNGYGYNCGCACE